MASRPYPFREKYFASSPELASYVTELALSSDDLDQMMKSRDVAHDVKEAIAAAPDFVSARISQRVAITICDWALKGNDVSTALLLVLSQAGAPAEGPAATGNPPEHLGAQHPRRDTSRAGR